MLKMIVTKLDGHCHPIENDDRLERVARSAKLFK